MINKEVTNLEIDKVVADEKSQEVDSRRGDAYRKERSVIL